MMDLATINKMSADAGKRAKKLGVQPAVFKPNEINVDTVGYKLPNLGNAVPKGWKRVSLEAEAGAFPGANGIYMDDADGFGAYFVDKTGWAKEGEPALTMNAFLKKLKPGLGYGIIEEGQFQIKVGAFAVLNN